MHIDGSLHQPVNPPVLFPAGHALLVHRPVQLSLIRKNDLVVGNDGLNDFVNMGLARHGILAVRDGHQSRAEADG